jgi:peptide/nickel transport system permease protein
MIRRVLQAALLVLATTVIVFIGLHFVGNPIDILVSPQADSVERLRLTKALGLDLPLWRQYLRFLDGVAAGDFGISFVYGQPALRLILERMPATFELAGAAMVIAVGFGIPLGLYAGLRPESPASRLVMGASLFGFSLPAFWVGLMLIFCFAVRLGWLPSSGRGATVSILGVRWSFLTLDGLRHLILPALNLALFEISLVIRLTRAGVREVLPQTFVLFAHAKGLSDTRVIFVHVLKNILIPVITVVGMEFGSLIAFAVVTESVFAWPGMGKLIIDSINLLDRPVIVAYLACMVVIFILINLIVDILYMVLDPRVRK